MEKYYKSDTFFCSDRQLAEDIGMHTDTVKRNKRYLAAAGWISYTAGKYEGKATEYTILRKFDRSKKFRPLHMCKFPTPPKIDSPAESTPLESPATSRPIQ